MDVTSVHKEPPSIVLPMAEDDVAPIQAASKELATSFSALHMVVANVVRIQDALSPQ
jgi:hypothetical protein